MAHTANLAQHHDATRGEGDDLTQSFYEREAEAYFDSTVEIDLSALWGRFAAELPAGGRILDAGSGSGRDTLHFLSQGFSVDAFDASPRLAALSSRLTGQKTAIDTFERWSAKPKTYDGVWAFAALLHVARLDLPEVVDKLAISLKPGGVLFASFKFGEGDTVDERGRRFTNLTPRAAKALLNRCSLLESIEVWDERARAAHGEITGWVYVLARRKA